MNVFLKIEAQIELAELMLKRMRVNRFLTASYVEEMRKEQIVCAIWMQVKSKHVINEWMGAKQLLAVYEIAENEGLKMELGFLLEVYKHV